MTEQLLGVSYIALWVLTITLYLAVFLLYRHIGSTMIATAERRKTHGPTLDQRPETLQGDVLEGDSVALGMPSDIPTLSLFASNNCQACQRLMPLLRTLAIKHRQEVRTVIVYEGTEAQCRELSSVVKGIGVVPDPDHALRDQWKIGVVPYAVTLGKDGSVQRKGPIPSDAAAVQLFEQPLVDSYVSRVGAAISGRLSDHASPRGVGS